MKRHFQQPLSSSIDLFSTSWINAPNKLIFCQDLKTKQGFDTQKSAILILQQITARTVKGTKWSLLTRLLPTGLAGYYRRFVQDFLRIAEPLTRLTRKSEPFVWSAACDAAFAELKRRLTSAPILTIPDQQGGFTILSDASGRALVVF